MLNVSGSDDEALSQRVDWMYLSGFGRHVTEQECDAAVAFLTGQAAAGDVTSEDSRLWGSLAHVLVNTKEFIFLR